ncbi:MAG TPA: hypothetical protein VGY76_10710 [Solirubrobacteraceae bacterium]|jgi:hypothetical protein|nr:hypothetical protein [Solirubrobacteraceae bacterium]
MGEFATYQNERFKIGTCEDLTGLRADQWHLVTVEFDGCDEATYLKQSRFRFPWPDEDAITPGCFTEHNRSCLLRGLTPPEEIKDRHRSVQFSARGGYLCSLPCPESGIELDGVKIHRNGYQGAVHLCAQRWWNGLLVGVLRCDACGLMWRLETLADAEPVAVALRSEADRHGASRAWYHTVADRLLAGYRKPAADAPETPSEGGSE